MAQKKKAQSLPTTISIPPIVFGPEKHPIGNISHILDNGGERTIVGTEEIKVSTRRKATLYKFSDGQEVIITDRNKIDRPDGVDGVLRRTNGELSWLSHRALEEFQEQVATKGLPALVKEIANNWDGKFNFHSEVSDSSGNIVKAGLRPPQIGGLHSIGAH